MASRKSIRSGRTCARIGHSFPPDYLVCRRCHRDLPSIKRGDSEIFRLKQRKTGPWFVRLFRQRRVPRVPRQSSMCADCAFRPGSPERRDAYGVWQSVLSAISQHQPFYCHEGMPTDERGLYCPAKDARGRPLGARLCGGWLADHAVYHRPGHGLHSRAATLSTTEIDGDIPPGSVFGPGATEGAAR